MKILRRQIRKWKNSLEGRSFVRLQNFQLWSKGTPVRLGYDGTRYFAEDELGKIFVASKSRTRLYLKGIKPRLNALADQYFFKEIDIKSGDTVVDCGANIGELGLYLHENHPGARYIAFEPAPDEFDCLRRNIPDADNRQKALWHEKDKLTFYVNPKTADSSLINNTGVENTIEIDCVRLDKELGDQTVKLLKLEAEGAEPEALMGCAGLLERCTYVVVDAGPERGPTQEPTAPEVCNFLFTHGFRMRRILPGRLIILFERPATDQSKSNGRQ